MVPIQANVAQLDLLEPFVICFYLTYLINYKNDFVEGIFSFPKSIKTQSTLKYHIYGYSELIFVAAIRMDFIDTPP